MTRPRSIVLLGMMAKLPVPGVVWQTVHYLLGFRALGLRPYYVEAHGRTPSMLMQEQGDDAAGRAAAFIARVMNRFDLGDCWAYEALHDDGRCYGMSAARLRMLYREAELIVNLHGGTEPRPEHYEGGRLVYLETDPVQLQVELHDGVQKSVDFLEPHCAFFTFAENLGTPDCHLPVSERFQFRPTRQPVVGELWADVDVPQRPRFTTIGNWRQPWRNVQLGGETYSWSKDREWRAFLDLPRRSGQQFELALSSYEPEHKQRLEERGFGVVHALDFDVHGDDYRRYIAGSLAEFTVAKQQNVHFRTGWFSDRSATYLAAGRPVVTQDTGFGAVLPTGEGLFAVADVDQAAEAIEAIAAEPDRHRRAASAIARDYFDAGRVLGDLLGELGITTTKRRQMTAPAARRPLARDARVLALIPHFKCEEWLADALESLTEQTRPLDGIVVIDDASDAPPVELVERFPQVTLLHADRNVGPYRLVQQVIEETDYDAYLFQDADDWSAPDRLEELLAGAESTGAELIGTQEIRVFCDEPEVAAIEWPLDVHAQFADKPTAFPLLHPTSLVSRDLVMELRGFASGLRFSGDAEFLRRARFVAKVANIPTRSYYRRIRPGSLTTARATGLRSPERQRVMEMLWERARSNADAVGAGREPDLSPIETAPPVGLRRLAGPPLRRPGERAPAPGARVEETAPEPPRGGPPRPIFVIGAERSGVSALAWALAQHPAIPIAEDGSWMSELASELPVVHARTFGANGGTGRRTPVTPERFSRTFGRAAAALVGDRLARWVDCAPEHTHHVEALGRLFPEALFIHVVRDADEAIGSLVDPPLGSAGATGGTQIPARLRERVDEREAVERWTAAVRAGVEAEQTLGEERVLRVSYEALIDDPKALLHRCLDFVGERYDGRCLRPLRGVRKGAPAAEPRTGRERAEAHPALRAAARALSADLLGSRAGRAANGAVRKPRVVLVTDHFPKFSETFFAREFTGLLERGWDMHVLTNRSNRDQWPYFPELRELLERRERVHVVSDFEKQLGELRPEIVHFSYGTLARGRMHVRELVGAKVVLSFRGYDINYFGLDDPGCYDDVWEHADVLHLVSEDVWSRAQRRGCPSDKPHLVVTDAIDVGAFTAPERRYEPVGDGERPLRLLGVGRLHWKKGYEYALAAVRRLLDAGLDIRYRILGDGPHRESILFSIHDLGLEDHVELAGASTSEEVRAAMEWADVHLHAAVSEGFCVSVIEAQAMGLPVVCTDADGLPENVAHGETGFVVPRRDARALARRIRELARDDGVRARMGAAARRRAEERFDVSRQLDGLESLYRTALARPAGDAEDGELVGDLERELASVSARGAALEKQLRGRRIAQGVRELVREVLPSGATVLVASRGDERVVDLGGRTGWHFPQTQTGVYAGYHPRDSESAIEHLEVLRERGATHFVIPSTSSWWLDHYQTFTQHLDEHYARLPADPECCFMWALVSVPSTTRNRNGAGATA